MAKRDWAKDRKLRAIDHRFDSDQAQSIADLAAKAGKPLYSKATQKLMNPAKGRRIKPGSPEWVTICERIKQNT